MSTNKVIAEYIWCDSNNGLRSKTKYFTLDTTKNNVKSTTIASFPDWNYDGSSTGQATTENSEVLLRPVSFVKDFIRKKHITNVECYLVLCETYSDNEPLESNSRFSANKLFSENLKFEPKFGLELEFFLMQNSKPLGIPNYPEQLPPPQGNYYCGIGTNNAIGRRFIEEVLTICSLTNLSITGLNAEVAPGQWEFQVCDVGIEACDQFIFLRYIMERLGEDYDLSINYEPKPIEGDWNGSGCHINFSTKQMRETDGLTHIMNAINKLEKKHKEHMEVYGKNNNQRLTGHHETANYETFSHGVADRGKSIRIPTNTFNNKKGYFEDRRPASNIDPYLACIKIFETSCL